MRLRQFSVMSVRLGVRLLAVPLVVTSCASDPNAAAPLDTEPTNSTTSNVSPSATSTNSSIGTSSSVTSSAQGATGQTSTSAGHTSDPLTTQPSTSASNASSVSDATDQTSGAQQTTQSDVNPNTTDVASTTEETTSEPTGEPAVRFIGRFVKDGDQAAFAWSGSGIVAAFEGTEVAVTFDDGGSNQFTVVVDGAVQPVLKTQSGSHSYPLAQGLETGRHEVEIYRRTEASVGVTTFEGLTFGDAGVLAAPPAATPRRLELIGDSISCGYGNEGADTSCSFTEDTENHYLTYGAIAARTLDAELSTVAWSGKGVVNNYDTDTTNPMPSLYNRVLPDDANSRWDFAIKPHAVIINLGTNDFSTDGDPTTEQFRDGYMGLVAQVRAGAPDAFILCTVGNMLSGADLDAARAGIHAAVDALSAAGDANIAAWDMDVPNDDPGCDWHPKVVTHELMADALVAELSQHLGW